MRVKPMDKLKKGQENSGSYSLGERKKSSVDPETIAKFLNVSHGFARDI